MDSTSLRHRLERVRERIEAAQERSGHTAPVSVVAVTKTHPVATLRTAYDAGVRDLGENRVAELEAKVGEMGRDAFRWHLVGHLQRNKARRAIPLFDLLHSLDSLRLAEQLSGEALKLGREVHALLQVNTSGEASKFGLAPAEAIEAAGRMAELPSLRLVGVMTMAPLDAETPLLRRIFAAAYRLFNELSRQVPGFEARHLSMGMSNDYEIAVEEGSNLVRLGTALFGERAT
jgi:PLP dependent protein